MNDFSWCFVGLHSFIFVFLTINFSCLSPHHMASGHFYSFKFSSSL